MAQMGATGASIEELNDSKSHSYDVIFSFIRLNLNRRKLLMISLFPHEMKKKRKNIVVANFKFILTLNLTNIKSKIWELDMVHLLSLHDQLYLGTIFY